MKIQTRSQKSNLKELLEAFRCSPAKDEEAFRDALLGKNSLHTVQRIVEEYECRFEERHRISLTQYLAPKGRYLYWDDLELHIKNACQVIYRSIDSAKEDESLEAKELVEALRKQINFFDKLRYILYSIPRRTKRNSMLVKEVSYSLISKELPGKGRDGNVIMSKKCLLYKEVLTYEKEEERPNNNEGKLKKCLVAYVDYTEENHRLMQEMKDFLTDRGSWNDVSCFLCWRSVLRMEREKLTPLCYEHRNLYSTDLEYRRRKNLRKYMEDIYNELYLIVTGNPSIWKNPDVSAEEFFLKSFLDLNGYFPNLAKYMHGLNAEGLAPGDLMRLLEGPIPYKTLTKEEKTFWESYFKDCEKFFALKWMNIIRAEAWLRADAEHKHGGKRVSKKTHVNFDVSRPL